MAKKLTAEEKLNRRITTIKQRITMWLDNGWKPRQEDKVALAAYNRFIRDEGTAEELETALATAEALQKARGTQRAIRIARNYYR